MRLDTAHYTIPCNYTKTHFSHNPIISRDMTWLRQLVTDPQRPRFNNRPVYMESVIYKIVAGKSFLTVLQF